eukprot:1552911-Amphidinium_carterae.1
MGRNTSRTVNLTCRISWDLPMTAFTHLYPYTFSSLPGVHRLHIGMSYSLPRECRWQYSGSRSDYIPTLLHL